MVFKILRTKADSVQCKGKLRIRIGVKKFFLAWKAKSMWIRTRIENTRTPACSVWGLDPIMPAHDTNPDPGYGAFFTPGAEIRDGKKSKTRILFLRTWYQFFGLKKFNSLLRIRDPG
jgi:hypothetical protein